MASSKPKRSLEAYDAKRDFLQSPEPAGKVKPRDGGNTFCVQKHLASHLHYDFRLEHNGVLLSWAVPKGPSLNPADKRMAVHVEDHPVDYGGFEGVIPQGYGAGIVLLWDRGTWTPDPATPDVDAALAKGELKFSVEGVKLKGSWVLVRTKRQAPKGPEQWLLIKHRDPWSGEIDVAAELPQSVKSFGGLADVLRSNGTPGQWKTDPPVRGGETGKLLKEVMAEAVAAPTPVRKKTAKRKPKPAPVAVEKSALSMRGIVPKLSNQTKVLYPATGFTKGDLVEYYKRIAPLILPYLAGRAITLKRFPDGVDGKAFFEKRCASHRPDWVKTLTVPRSDKNESIDYCAIGDLPTLIWAANLAAIELHVPLALAAEPDLPTWMVFDLDPGEPAVMADCIPVALKLRGMLDHLGLTSVIKTSGGKGVHLLIPLNASGVTFDDTKTFARAVAMTLEKEDPRRIISSMTRSARAGKIFIDWSQNDRNKTTVGVFSVRARPTPTVSWPVEWEHLDKRLKNPLADKAEPDQAAVKKWYAVLGKTQKLPKFEKQ